jgi:hypothetical protein
VTFARAKPLTTQPYNTLTSQEALMKEPQLATIFYPKMHIHDLTLCKLGSSASQ